MRIWWFQVITYRRHWLCRACLYRFSIFKGLKFLDFIFSLVKLLNFFLVFSCLFFPLFLCQRNFVNNRWQTFFNIGVACFRIYIRVAYNLSRLSNVINLWNFFSPLKFLNITKIFPLILSNLKRRNLLGVHIRILPHKIRAHFRHRLMPKFLLV